MTFCADEIATSHLSLYRATLDARAHAAILFALPDRGLFSCGRSLAHSSNSLRMKSTISDFADLATFASDKDKGEVIKGTPPHNSIK